MSKKIITHNNGIIETRETFYTEETIQKLKQQLEEKDNYHLRYELAGADETIANLKKQLEEKDKEIKKLNWQLKDKDFIIKNLNHSLSVAPNANAGQRARIDELTKIVEEKNKEIESLKKADNIWLDSYQNELDTLRQSQTQLAIQELEKVKDTLKHFCNIHSDEYYGVKAEVKGIELDVCESIDYQIRELKGE